MEITVYSREFCQPCMALKAWFAQEKIPYKNVFTKDLNQAERKWLREEILRVSKLKDPTVPAVQIVNGKHEVWVSNHGESDVTEMIGNIKKVLGLA